MLALPTKRALFLALIAASSVGSGVAFAPRSFSGRSSSPHTALSATVDPTVVTKKEYQDICGVDFNDSTLADRLARTAYLYPKHVEVIEDFAPMVDRMVDEIVSAAAFLGVEIMWEIVQRTNMAFSCTFHVFALFFEVYHGFVSFYYSPFDVVIPSPPE